MGQHFIFTNYKTISQHFNSPGQSLGDLLITVTEQVRKNDLVYRTEREQHQFGKLYTWYMGSKII